MRRLAWILVIALILLLALVLPAGAQPKVIVNGETLDFDVPPTVAQGRTLVPLRAIFGALDAEVHWDGATQTVTATRGGTVIELTIGQAESRVNNTSVVLDVPARIADGRTMVPLRFVGESLGARVDYTTGVITITTAAVSPKPVAPPPAPVAPRAAVDLALERGLTALLAREASTPYAPWTAVALRAGGVEPRPGAAGFVGGLPPDAPTTTLALALLATVAEDGSEGRTARQLAQRLAKLQRPDGKFADLADGSGGDLINAHVWAIIALRASGTPVPAPEAAYEWLAAQQLSDGGFFWAVGAGDSDVDTTAMVLSALAALDRRADDPVVRRALDYLRRVQSEATGGFGGWGMDTTADSCAVVIQALVALGQDPAGPAWSNRAGNPLIALLDLQEGSGMFAYAPGLEPNLMSTQQAVLALADYQGGAPFWKGDRHVLWISGTLSTGMLGDGRG